MYTRFHSWHGKCRCSFFPATWKQGCKRKGNWVTISLNLQPTIPLLPLSSFYTSSLSSLSLSLFPFFSQFCLLQRHCFPSVPNYEGKLRDRKSRNSSLFQGTNDTNAFSLVQTDTLSYFQLRRRFVCAWKGKRGETTLFQMSK